jgi:hypothetical protein
MYYTGINPLTMKPVYVATDYHEKQLQRALLQFNRPQNADLVREALTKAGITDLIGYDKNCLVRPAQGRPAHTTKPHAKQTSHGKKPPQNARTAKSTHTAPSRGKKQTSAKVRKKR